VHSITRSLDPRAWVSGGTQCAFSDTTDLTFRVMISSEPRGACGARGTAGDFRGMQREDYLLRMIAQMGLVLARIRQMLLEGKNSEAGAELEHAAQKGGIDLRLVSALDEASLRPLLLTGGEIDRPKCSFFAELMYLEWRRQLAMGRMHHANRCAQRGLLLYALAYDGIVMGDEARQRVAELEEPFEAGELHDEK
jgi:hypothetical protein